MNQKLSDWASVAEIVSGIAVVVTLVILVIGIRENTEITRTAMYASTLDQFNALETVILTDPELRSLYVRYLNSDTADLDQEEIETIAFMVGVTTRVMDRAFSANQNRQLGEEEWARLERSLCTNYQRAESSGHLSTIQYLTTTSYWEYASSTCSDYSVTSPRLDGDNR